MPPGTTDLGALSIRRADPAADAERILAVLGRNLPQAASSERLEWLYRSNPDGPALVWLAEDASGAPVGTSAAHPRRMRLEGRVVLALNLSDFAFDPAYRSLGPALRLLKATLAPVRRGEFAFSYDYPSESMHALYRRLGGADLGANARFVRPVDLRPMMERRLGGVVGRVAGAAGDLALRARDKLTRGTGSVRVALLEGGFTSEFDRLDGDCGAGVAVSGVRDAAYLEWRYRRHTMWTHDVLCARRDGELHGFAVLRQEEPGVLALVDLCAAGADTGRALAAAAVAHARERGAEALHAQALEEGPAATLLKRVGFVRREGGAGPVPWFPPDHPSGAALGDRARWWLMGGDRDI